MYVVEDGKYGQRDNSGNWNGMIGELDRRVSVSDWFIVTPCDTTGSEFQLLLLV